MGKETKEKILESAHLEFFEMGFEGARMRSIADRAGINKGLLHYYFKTKDSLFEALFEFSFKKKVALLEQVFTTDGDIFELIETYVQTHISIIKENPYFAVYILDLLNRDPEKLKEHFKLTNFIRFGEILQIKIDEGVKAGKVRPTNGRHLLLNMLSMVLYPVITKALVKNIYQLSENDYNTLLEERKKIVPEFIKNALSV